VLLERLYRFRLTIMLTSVGALAAALRFIGLSRPKDLVFDEVYYARGAYSLLHLGYEGRWSPPSSAFVTGDFSGLDTHADFVVHPPLGKWMIAVGMKLFGNGPFGWRFSGALIGTVTVILVALIARHLFHSVLWGGIAGLFLAIDGQHIVASRTSLLDVFLTFFLVAAFGLLLLDRRRHRRILAKRAKRARERLGLGPDDPIPGLGPGGGIRWWRLAAIVTLGLATGVKWSGLYAALAFLVLSVVWDLVDRHAVGVRLFVLGSIVRSMLPAVMATVILLPAAYVGSWTSWFVSDSSYMRHWAEIHPDEGVTWLPDSLRSFVEYHHDMWNFHTGLTSTNGVHHSYQAGAWGFIVQYRPTAYYWKTAVPVTEPPCGDHDCVVEVQGALKTNSAAIAGEHCGSDKCVSAITALGNPLLVGRGGCVRVGPRQTHRPPRPARWCRDRRHPGWLASVDALPRSDHVHVLLGRVFPMGHVDPHLGALEDRQAPAAGGSLVAERRSRRGGLHRDGPPRLRVLPTTLDRTVDALRLLALPHVVVQQVDLGPAPSRAACPPSGRRGSATPATTRTGRGRYGRGA